MLVPKQPILVVHGLFGSQSAPEIRMAFGDADIHAPDLIGYGGNDAHSGDAWRLEDQAEHVAAFIRRLNLGPVHLVGHSVGGAVAALTAIRHPALIASYTSVEGNFTLKDAFWSRSIAQKDFAEVEDIIAGYRADPDGWMSRSVAVMTPLASRIAREWLANQPAATIWMQARAVVDVTARADYIEAIHTLMASDLPVYLIAGARSADGWDVPHWGNAMCDMRINITGTGHLMMVEEPDAYARAVLTCVTFGER
jgi:pimeloyl-ACP methyl ester carboxylesterase